MGGGPKRQRGISFIGLVLILVVVGSIAIVGFKVFPSVVENRSIDSALKAAVVSAKSAKDVRDNFDKNAATGYIDTISGKDLDVDKNDDGGFDASYAYSKKIELFNSVSLLIDFSGSTKKH